MNMKGLFVTIEGIDGVGKSTCAKALAEELRKRYPEREVVSIKTPGETEAGKEIRKIVLNPELSLESKARFLMFVADMHQVTEEIVKPVLSRGGIVISDRYRDSTFVYQIRCNSDLDDREAEIFEDILDELTVGPDVVFVLDLPVADAKKRILASRKQFVDAFERAPENIWQMRRVVFRDVVVYGNKGEDYHLLPASRPTADLAKMMMKTIEKLLEEKSDERKQAA